MSILARKVLVLNKGWNPVGIVTLKRALCLVKDTYKNNGEPKARILEPILSTDTNLAADAPASSRYSFVDWTWDDWSELKAADGEAVIRDGRGARRIPEIILLSRYNRIPMQQVRFSRRTLWKRDNNTCMYCGAQPGASELSIDHVLPRSRGGLTTWTNCTLACVQCNRRKADKTPEEVGMRLLAQPYKPEYTLWRGDYKCESWEAILGEMYWSVELKNDMR